MASTIRTDCTSCGTVDVSVTAGRLLLGTAPGVSNVVEFTCPNCRQVGRHAVDERGTRLLSAAGITLAYPDDLSNRSVDTRVL
ncbi:MAG TPA: hypothetical protein VFT67_00840 [Jatrophihabitantaceae bacterium]|nr:hypothetical protein [Jatrophihabitantaceae bacterium]